jgi:hypothetical protein
VRAVPPFTLDARPGAGWAVAVIAVAVVAAADSIAWLAARADLGASAVALPAAAAVAAGMATLTLLRGAPAELQWSDAGWRLGGVAGSVVVCLDLGGWVLLRFMPRGARAPWRAVWLPLSATGTSPGAWHALRCALRAAPPATPAADD